MSCAAGICFSLLTRSRKLRRIRILRRLTRRLTQVLKRILRNSESRWAKNMFTTPLVSVRLTASTERWIFMSRRWCRKTLSTRKARLRKTWAMWFSSRTRRLMWARLRKIQTQKLRFLRNLQKNRGRSNRTSALTRVSSPFRATNPRWQAKISRFLSKENSLLLLRKSQNQRKKNQLKGRARKKLIRREMQFLRASIFQSQCRIQKSSWLEALFWAAAIFRFSTVRNCSMRKEASLSLCSCGTRSITWTAKKTSARCERKACRSTRSP